MTAAAKPRGGRPSGHGWSAERASIEYRIRSEITGASEVLALRQAALSQEQQGAAEELVQIAVVAYREGEVGILELLDAARTASRARTRSIDLRLDARLAQIALERAVGDIVALKSWVSTLLITVLAAGCNRSAAPEAAPEEPEALSVTRWTDKTELFAEYPPLAVGSTSRFAIHLTRLERPSRRSLKETWKSGSKAVQPNRKCFAWTRRLAPAFSEST